MNKFLINTQQGSAGIYALLCMILLTIIGGAFITMTSTEVLTAANYRDGVAAQYLAEAGVQDAIVKLKTNDNGIVDSTKTQLKKFPTVIKNDNSATQGMYSVTIIGNGNLRTITSTGTVNSAKRQLIVTVQLGSQDESDSVFKYAAFSGNKMTINSGATINGDVGTWHPDITQNGGTINGNIDLKVRQDKKFKDFPSFKSNDYDGGVPLGPNLERKNYSLSGVYYVNGNLNMNGATLTATPGSSATIFVNSGTSLGGNIIGDITIVANGGINVNSGGRFDNVKIYANGDMTIDSSITNALVMSTGSIYVNQGTSKAVIYAQKNLYYNSGVTTGGSIVAGHELTINGGTITYDSSVVEQVTGISNGPAFAIISWSNK
ncbi:hypothetical protein SDC9_76252 [bioreactor metagenome]|uniref:Type 4 fimbrial biogenesis protein PilX N-terminal domain-containing protein n=1 Tax=bioreactor metagenome TaxID=1076179 RepID=A0A644YM58_9ZZZZ